ncbi:hypothetical protein IQ273_30810 [Nodosilinea sp. LEGE 07298]|uniref:hypothetical protein n=1 Tax=Nodosilinea sp. LEGE 07298 TaxID=2777970 RepID=UPI00187F5152|nr:hypothetical protein [Nodosilinea sp. LEGE 07298]MBE9113765.1 hypothetical protein [Nodosilinea sp. LEGE 07298]
MSTQTSTGTAWAMVVAYPSHGKRYYRFMAGLGDSPLGTLRERIDTQRHIPGGACGTPTAEARASEVGRWLRLGRSTKDVLGLINSWGRAFPSGDASRTTSSATGKSSASS